MEIIESLSHFDKKIDRGSQAMCNEDSTMHIQQPTSKSTMRVEHPISITTIDSTKSACNSSSRDIVIVPVADDMVSVPIRVPIDPVLVSVDSVLVPDSVPVDIVSLPVNNSGGRSRGGVFNGVQNVHLNIMNVKDFKEFWGFLNSHEST